MIPVTSPATTAAPPSPDFPTLSSVGFADAQKITHLLYGHPDPIRFERIF